MFMKKDKVSIVTVILARGAASYTAGSNILIDGGSSCW